MSASLLHGGCHCGALSLRFATKKPLAALPLLACQCDFCRKHNSRATADPAGRLRLKLARPAALRRYRFGLETADYLLCGDCGVYLGAICPTEDGERGLLNINCLDDATGFATTATPVRYDGESRAERLDRRRRSWTPVVWGEG